MLCPYYSGTRTTLLCTVVPYECSLKTHHCGHFPLNTAGGKDIGFTTIRQGSQLIDGQRCHNEKYETIITWNCDGKKVWDSSSTDASRFVISVSRLELLNCTVSSYLSCLNGVNLLHKVS